MPGPPPKHPSIRARRNKPNVGFTQLPAEGRDGPAPAWPLLDPGDSDEESTAAERELWATLWGYPQAVVWEKSKAFRAVALYVRLQVKAEQGDKGVLAAVGNLSDRLGLSPLALLRLRCEIVAADVAEEKAAASKRAPAKTRAAKTDPRQALRAV